MATQRSSRQYYRGLYIGRKCVLFSPLARRKYVPLMLCFFLNFCLICFIFFNLQLHNFPFIFLLSFFFFQISLFFLFPLHIYPEMISTNSPPTRGGLVGAGGCKFSNIYAPYREVYICDMEIVRIWFLWPLFTLLQEKVFGNFFPAWGKENL